MFVRSARTCRDEDRLMIVIGRRSPTCRVWLEFGNIEAWKGNLATLRIVYAFGTGFTQRVSSDGC